MKGQFFRDHLIGFEVVAALAIGALLRFGFDAGWVLAILSGPLILPSFVPSRRGPFPRAESTMAEDWQVLGAHSQIIEITTAKYLKYFYVCKPT